MSEPFDAASRVHRLPQRARRHRGRRADHRRRDPQRARRPARLAQAHRQRELRLAGRAADDGHLAVRQVRRGHGRAPLLRRLPEHRHRRAGRRRPRQGAVRRAARLRPAALGHRRQPRRVLGDPRPPHRVAGAGEGRRQARQRPVRGRLAAAAPRPRRPARAGHVARRRRPPDARLPPEHQRQDVPPVLLRHRPEDRPARLRRGARAGAGVQAARAHRRLLRLPAQGQLRHDARDRRRGRRRR